MCSSQRAYGREEEAKRRVAYVLTPPPAPPLSLSLSLSALSLPRHPLNAHTRTTVGENEDVCV